MTSAAPGSPNAADALHGFRYQLLQSLSAWLNLRADEELWLEVSEDYSIVSGTQEHAVQVKTSRAAAGATRRSLQSKDVRAALGRFWARQESSPGARLTFMANGGAAVERDYTFPNNVSGLVYWEAAARGADCTPIRQVVSELFNGEPLGTWLASDPSDQVLRERLLRRVEWALSAANANDLNTQLCDQLAIGYQAMGLPLWASSQGVQALLSQVFEVASQPDPARRKLTIHDRHQAIDATVKALIQARHIGAASQAAAEQFHSVLVDEVCVTSAMAERIETTATIAQAIGSEPLIWLHGGHGTGKSTLARLLACRYGGFWIALDLRPVQGDAAGVLAAWRELLRIIAN